VIQSVSRIWIIYKSNVTTFKLSVVFEAAGAAVKVGLSLKPNVYKHIMSNFCASRFSLIFPASSRLTVKSRGGQLFVIVKGSMFRFMSVNKV